VAALQQARRARGPADSWEDRPLQLLAEEGNGNSPPPAGATCVLFSPSGVETLSGPPLLYYPYPGTHHSEPVLPPTLRDAETLELADGNLEAAYASALAHTSALDPQVRAAAWLLAIRCLRKEGLAVEALRASTELARIPQSSIRGIPGPLLARSLRAGLLAGLQRNAHSRDEARNLHAELLSGQWRISGAVFHYYRQEAIQRLGTKPAEDTERLSVSAAAATLWDEWRERPSLRGLRLLEGGDSPVLALWRGQVERAAVLLAGSRFLNASLHAGLAETARAENIGLRIEAAERHAQPPSVVRTVHVAGVPWSVTAWPLDPALDQAAIESRGTTVLTGFSLLGIVVLTSAFFAVRMMRRGLELSRLKSDFVAAVSHDFRTPPPAVPATPPKPGAAPPAVIVAPPASAAQPIAR